MVGVFPPHPDQLTYLPGSVKRTATAELDVLQEQAALVEVSQQVLALLKLTDHQQQSLCVYFHRNFTLNEWITFQVKFQAETLVEGAYFNSHLQRVATVLMESSSVRNEPLSSPHTLPVNPDCVLQRDVLAGMRHKDFGWKATYGGQLLGQGVLANGTSCSSFHQHFIRGGQVNKDSEISLTNGNQVTIKQDGKVIFRAASVLHELPKLANPASPQPAPPAVTTPKAQLEFAMPQYLRDAVFKQMGLEFQLELSGGSFRHRCHVRFANPARALVMNQALLAYVCDFVFPSTAISAHGVSVWEGEAKLMSFSGNFYFLYDVDLSAAGWITLEAHCPVLVNGRALVTIDMFNSDRTQIARGVQEVLVMLK
ncbi:hypothetical protein BASA81_005611 [Batrachochytrium salamandrivorans]|nr:hypothetical protein BASA81_005611 [Batrachochytrium salamandrivorans]